MKILNELKFLLRNKMKFLALLPIILIGLIFIPVPKVYAATSPDLGQAASFSILSSTYTNTAAGTTINGDLGYTTGPAWAPTVNGVTYGSSSKYTTAGTDQNSAKDNLNNQAPCTSLGDGAVNLDNATGHETGIYTTGCYSSGGAMNITVGQTVTLQGPGTFIFKPTGALTTQANTTVQLTLSASECDVFWVPTAATTLGADSTFVGTDIDAAGITIGNNVTWTGRALAFGGTVSTDADTITSTTCTAASTPTPTPTSNATTSTSTSTTNSAPAAPYCQPISDQIVASTIIESRRIDADSIFISWGPYSGVDTFNVRYGPANGNWLYNTDVTGFSTTINALPSNQPIWVQVAARSDCTIGTYGEAKLVGGGGGSRVLGASTDTLAATGSNDQFLRITIAATAALFFFLLGKTLLRGNETS